MSQYETVIGLEVHIELATRSKIFCGCSTAFGAKPNSQICPVCMGLPGALPVLNRKVVEYAIAVGLALNCRITGHCKFDRKNYFYPDNPQNYQISQLYLPICREGFLEIEAGECVRKIGIAELHMEEDAGKLIHDEEQKLSYVDYNRSGVPLIEIVTKPDFRTAEEVKLFLQKLRSMILYLGVSDCKLQEGSMRVDVNLSVRKAGSRGLGTRTEMKNLGSFRAVSAAIQGEAKRQIKLLEAGENVVMETRRWDEKKETSYVMRSKEDVRDYRYFPEPDLPPIIVSEEWIDKIRRQQPELAHEKKQRYMTQFQIPAYDAGILTAEKAMADFFERAVEICDKPKKVSNWLMGETLRLLNENEMEAEQLRFPPASLAKLIDMIDDGTITGTVGKQVFERMFYENAEPETYVKEQGLAVIEDKESLEQAVREVISENPKSVADYHAGKERAMGFLTGQVMRKMKGRANPKQVQEILYKFV